MQQLNNFRGLGKSWFSKAENFLNQSKEELKKSNYSDSIFASINCIEFSIKSIYLFYGYEFPKIHKVELEIGDEKKINKKFKIAIKNLEAILEKEKFPSHISRDRIIRAFFYFKFWGEFYTLVKYGSKTFWMGPEKLFGEKEANLALNHADECRLLAYHIKDYLNLY